MSILAMDEYEKIKADAYKSYKEIGSVFCPLLGKTVQFTNIGFNHLIRKGRMIRPREEQVRRFELIRYLVEIVSCPRADVHLDDSKSIKMWNIIKNIHGSDIRVVVADTGFTTIFVSVYPPRKTKNPTEM